MTTPDELVERVARLYEDKWGVSDYGLARAAIAAARPVLRAETLEETARVADRDATRDGDFIAAAIRAMISTPPAQPAPEVHLEPEHQAAMHGALRRSVSVVQPAPKEVE